MDTIPKVEGVVDDMVAGHDASTETPPRCPIYHPSYKIAKAKLIEMIELLREPLEKSTYTDPNVEGLKTLLKKRSRVRFPDEVRVALVGDMASGKSSLINSLLGVGILARKGDIGTSCTWVIQEFRSTLPKQTTPFRAEIEYYSEAELESIVTFLFEEAYKAKPPSDNDSEVHELNDESNQRSVSALTAIKTIVALFCDKSECASEEAVVNFIKEAPSIDDKNIIQKMLIWSGELLRNYMTADGDPVSVIEHTTTQGLLQDLREYTFNSMDENDYMDAAVSPWPLIKKITFGLDVPLLRDGVILVDLPGVRDSNTIRRRTVGKALAECTRYLVVAQISRAQDDETVNKYFQEGHNRKGTGRVIAAITFSDSIDGELKSKDAAQRQKMDEIKEKILSVTDELAKVRAEKKKKKSVTKQGMIELYEKEEQLERDLHDLHSAEESQKILIRNKKTVMTLRRNYTSMTGDQRPLAVFCVSNKLYEQYQIGFDKSDQPTLTLEDTEIPKLRRHLRLATGEGRYNEALFHYETQIPSLLTSFELWCFKTHMKRRKELEEIVREPKETCEAVVQSLFGQVRAIIETEILILMKQKERNWNTAATRLCEKWSKEHSIGAYRALLKKDGYRKSTKSKPGASWNSDLIRIMEPDLSPGCEKVQDLIVHLESTIALELEQPLSRIREKILADPQSTLMALSPFLKKVEQEKPIMRNLVARCFSMLKIKLKVWIHNLTTNTENSFVSEQMQAVYHSASLVVGIGSGSKRPAKVREGIVGDGALWMAVHARSSESLEELLNRRQGSLEKQVTRILEHLVESFQACCQDKDVEADDEKALRLHLKDNITKAKGIYDGALSKAMADCKEYQV